MLKVRAELLTVAQLVHDGFRTADAGFGVICREDVDRAIAAQAQASASAKPFSEAQYAQLIELRSWAFKAPDKRLSLTK